MKKKIQRPHLPPVSEQMKAWSAALASEVSDWPQVGARVFFGFTALYRKEDLRGPAADACHVDRELARVQVGERETCTPCAP